MKRVGRSAKLALALVALLLLGMGYLGLMLVLGTTTPFVLVRGHSMEPTLRGGDLLIGKSISPAQIKEGDIIAFKVPPEESRGLKLPPTMAHRVLDIEGRDGNLVFVTKGDNSDVDPFKVPSSAVRAVVVKNLGPIGKPILFLTNGRTLIYLGLPVLTFILIVLATLWLTNNEKGARSSSPEAKVREPAPAEIEQALSRLTSAVTEYGAHLQSHTAIVKHLAGTSEGLEQVAWRQSGAADELNQAINQQNQVLADLAAVVKELKGSTPAMGTNGNGTSYRSLHRASKKRANGTPGGRPGHSSPNAYNGKSTRAA